MKKFLLLMFVLLFTANVSACSKQDPAVQTSTDIKAPIFTNVNTGEKLYLGMDSSVISRLYGKPAIDDWLDSYGRSINVLSIDGKIKYFLIDSSWKTDEGFTIGTPKSDIRSHYGNPTEQRTVDPKENFTLDIYKFEDNGSQYILNISYINDATVAGFTASLDNAEEKAKGEITFRESGTGNAVFKNVKAGPAWYFNIVHNGTGKFKVRAYDERGNEKILVNALGSYSGRLSMPDFYPFSLEITSDSGWTITSSYKHSEAIPYDNVQILNGTGDFVTDLFSLTPQSFKWKIDYNGAGPLVIKLHVPGPDGNEALLNVDGKYSGVVSSSLFLNGTLNSGSAKTGNHAGYTAYLEILSSGDWRIEPIK